MRFFTSTLPLLALVAPAALAAPVENVNAEIQNIEERAASTALTKVQLPTNTLPAPAAGLVLRWIGLGVGTQNYTCATADSTAVPASAGAVATLYDISALNNDPLASMKIPSMSSLALGASMVSKSVLEMYLRAMGYNKALGEHFFNETMTPTFHLSKLKNPVPAPELFSKKVANMPAPATACKGTKGEGAVDWLYLEDVGTSISGVKAVYRVETAGGKAPATCAGQKSTVNVPYAAQYWFYGLP